MSMHLYSKILLHLLWILDWKTLRLCKPASVQHEGIFTKYNLFKRKDKTVPEGSESDTTSIYSATLLSSIDESIGVGIQG